MNRYRYDWYAPRGYMLFVIALFVVSLLTIDRTEAIERDWMGIPETSIANEVLEYSTYTLILVDYGYTIGIIGDDRFQEVNSSIGADSDPRRSHINRYFILKLAGYALVNNWSMARKVKNYLNLHQIYVSVTAIKNHRELGVNFGIKF